MREKGIVDPDVDNSLFDSFLLQQFPGRTLEELDGMDVLRYFRAIDARRIDTLEEMAFKTQTGKLKGSDVSKEDWEEIIENQKLWEAYITPKDK